MARPSARDFPSRPNVFAVVSVSVETVTSVLLMCNVSFFRSNEGIFRMENNEVDLCVSLFIHRESIGLVHNYQAFFWRLIF